MDFSIDNLKALMDKMNETGLESFSFETGDVKLTIKGRPAVTVVSGADIPVMAAAPALAPAEAPAKPTGHIIPSPIVGTFYTSPAPNKAAFVSVGDRVKKGDVLFIIESMKLMNEVTSDCDGIVEQVFVKNGDAVEYGQSIMELRI